MDSVTSAIDNNITFKNNKKFNLPISEIRNSTVEMVTKIGAADGHENCVQRTVICVLTLQSDWH